MKRIALLFPLFLLLAPVLPAQNGGKWLRSFELEGQQATFDVIRGLAFRANHAWHRWDHASLQSGLQLSVLFRRTNPDPTRGEVRDLDMVESALLFNGITWHWGRDDRWRSHAEFYLGLRGYSISGTNRQSSQGFERSYSSFTPKFDFGIRSGIGYRVLPRMHAQVVVTTSLADVNNPLGLGAGLLYASPDVLTLVGVGLVYRL